MELDVWYPSPSHSSSHGTMTTAAMPASRVTTTVLDDVQSTRIFPWRKDHGIFRISTRSHVALVVNWLCPTLRPVRARLWYPRCECQAHQRHIWKRRRRDMIADVSSIRVLPMMDTPNTESRHAGQDGSVALHNPNTPNPPRRYALLVAA
jgi:hypothetical protein